MLLIFVHVLISFMAECSINVFQTWLQGHSLKFQAQFWHRCCTSASMMVRVVRTAKMCRMKETTQMSRADPLQVMLEIWQNHPPTIRSRTVGETGIMCMWRLEFRVFKYFQIVCSQLHQRELPVWRSSGISTCLPSLKADTARACAVVHGSPGMRACISRRSSCPPPIQWHTRLLKEPLSSQKRMRSAPFSDVAKSQLFPFRLCFVSLSTQYFSLITLARLMWKVE